MNRELQEAWVAALRAGKHEPAARGRLRDLTTGGFCCLGVLCDVAIKLGHLDAVWEEDGDWWLVADVSMDQTLSRRVSELLGLSYGDMMLLAEANDRGVSFGGIADQIESGLNQRSLRDAINEKGGLYA